MPGGGAKVASDEPRAARIPTSDRRYTIAAVVFSVGASAVGLFLGYFHRIGTYGVETDFYGLYADQARSLLAGEPFIVVQNPPGYVLLLGGAIALIGDPFIAGKILSAAAAGTMGWLTYALVRPLVDARVALGATMLLLAALIPYSFVAATDLVGATFIVLPVVLFLRREPITPSACLGAGVAAGVAYLVRANAIFLVGGFALSLLLLLGRAAPWSLRLRNVAIVVGAFVLSTSPWLLYNWSVNGSPLASRTYLQVAAHFFHPQGDSSGWALLEISDSFRSMGDVFRHDPKRLLSVYLRDVLIASPISLARHALGIPAFVVAVMGLVLLLMRRTPRRLALLLIFAAGYLLMGLVGFFIRYYLFVFPLLCLLAAYFLLDRQTEIRLGGRWSRVPLNMIAFGAMLVMVLRGSLLDSRDVIRSEPSQLLEVADVMKEHASERDILIAGKPHLAYLAGVTYAFPVANTPEEFLSWARANGARFLLYNDAEAVAWPALRPFADPAGIPRAFRVLHRHQVDRTLLYEIIQ